MWGASLTSLLLVMTGLSMGGGIAFRTLYPFLTMWECMALAAPLGLTLSTWLAVVVKSILFRSVPGLPASLGLVVVLIQALVTFISLRNRLRTWKSRDTQAFAAQIAHFLVPFVFLFLLGAWMGYVHYTHSLLEAGGSYHVGGTVYGDLPFHLTIINSILHGNNQYATPLTSGLDATFFADSPLVYPWIPDYHAALIAGSGSSFHFALSVPGTFLTGSFFFLLFSLYFRMVQSRVVAFIGVLLTFFTGGIGGFYWLFFDGSWSGFMSEDHVLMNALTHEIEFYWFSLPAHILFPQRTTQFAYTMSLAALIVFHKAYTSAPALTVGKALFPFSPARSSPRKAALIDADEENVDGKPHDIHEKAKRDALLGAPTTANDIRKLFAYSGALTGLLPLLQVHSFAAVGLIVVAVAIVHSLQILTRFLKHFKTNKNAGLSFNLAAGDQLSWWVIYGGISWALGFPQNLGFFAKVLFPSHEASSQSFLRFMLISSDFPPQPNFVLLWLQGLGLFVPFYLISTFIFARNPAQWPFQVGFGLLFVVSNVVIFQPWVLDNTKVFYIAIFGMSPMVAQLIVTVWSWDLQIFKSDPKIQKRIVRGRRRTIDETIELGLLSSVARVFIRVVLILALVSLIFSGTLCVVRETFSYTPMYDRTDIELAQWFVENTPEDARIAVSTTGNHFRPSSALGGRVLLSSYWGWISNHGMPNFVERNDQVNRLLRGEGNPMELALTLRAEYIVVDVHRISTFSMRHINAIAYRVASNGRFIVYKVVPYDLLENTKDCLKDTASASINEDSCEQKGCIWAASAPGKPWCHVPPTQADGHATSDCGHFGISRHQCNALGCSYHQNYDGPHCHHPVSLGANQGLGGMCHLTVHPDGSNDCRQNNERQCLERGCIWQPNESNQPWCQIPSAQSCHLTSSFAALFSL